ncbi:hypothetical protein J8273_8124 [Carpediemonas membranifera]|uniref:Uncharacterized protein n=1 Tax=Carpediemonas membranifera TaxID=201153 RepID=A0A8J6B4V9_9EUKA|nr:hypothetical protein J8273_8124 [Carpediemonas membranifera]|eukprot:KAG9390087.1 hypothetical protein J8273_8124 [Carpediemonas membranifera]
MAGTMPQSPAKMTMVPREVDLGGTNVKLFTLEDKRDFLERTKEKIQERDRKEQEFRTKSSGSRMMSRLHTRRFDDGEIDPDVEKALKQTGFAHKQRSYSNYNPLPPKPKYAEDVPRPKEFVSAFHQEDGQTMKLKAALDLSIQDHTAVFKEKSQHSFRPDNYGPAPGKGDFAIRLNRIKEFERPVADSEFDRFNPSQTFKYAPIPEPPKPRTRPPEKGLGMHPATCAPVEHATGFVNSFKLPDRQHRISGEKFDHLDSH